MKAGVFYFSGYRAMAKLVKSIQHRPREPVLSEKALALGKKIAGNRELAIKFLKEHGFIERPGKLAKPYR